MMLCRSALSACCDGEHDLDDLDRLVVLVADRDLGLPVRAQVRQDLGLAHVGEAPGELVRQQDRHGHELRGLGAGVAEHHALVAGALAVEHVVVVDVGAHLEGGGDALADVGRLLVDGHHDAAGLVVVAEVGARVADLLDRLTDDLGDVDVGLGADLAGDEREAGGHERLASDTPVGVVLEDRIEDGVRDLVGELVRVALGDRLRGEEVVPLVQCSPPATRGAGEPARVGCGVRRGRGDVPRPGGVYQTAVTASNA